MGFTIGTCVILGWVFGPIAMITSCVGCYFSFAIDNDEGDGFTDYPGAYDPYGTQAYGPGSTKAPLTQAHSHYNASNYYPSYSPSNYPGQGKPPRHSHSNFKPSAMNNRRNDGYYDTRPVGPDGRPVDWV